MNPVDKSSTQVGDQQRSPAADRALVRLLDYFGLRTDWNRRLWNPGTVTVLRETLEAVDLLASEHLRAATVTDLVETARRRTGPDHGIGPTATRSALTAVLRSLRESPNDRVARHRLEDLIGGIEDGYLERWRDVLDRGARTLGPEEASRVLAGHLLGLGLHSDALHGWARSLAKEAPPSTLAELFDAADGVAGRPLRRWEVLVPFAALRHHEQEMPDEWLDRAGVARWVARNSAGTLARTNGGVLLQVTARDPWSAVEDAADQIRSLTARVIVGVSAMPGFEPQPEALVSGESRRFPLRHPRRQVEIHSLQRQNTLFSTVEPTLRGLRSAIDLAASLETGPPGVAVASGWAALEAVLARPATRNVQAASDLAALIACSFPRAELTPLAFAYPRENDDALATSLRQASSSRERCAVLGTAITHGRPLSFARPSDQVAAERIRDLLKSPKIVLGRVRLIAGEALRRLYRQRNMVLHAGKTNSVVMQTTLRTAPPLVGAGLDRFVQEAVASRHHDPLALVARAENALESCGDDGGPEVWDLLRH